MLIELISEYGLFLLKVITIVVSLIILIGVILNSKKTTVEGNLIVKNLNEDLDSLEEIIKKKILSKKEFKSFSKSKKNKNKNIKNKLFVIDFKGNVRASEIVSLRREISGVLLSYKKGDEVLIRLENSGGTVHEHGLAASQLKRIRDKKIPLTICVDKVAASGGYMMACVGNKIIASPFAIIGSIGVLAQVPNFNKLLKNKGIDFEQQTAGDFKRTVTMFGKNTEKDRKKLKEQLEDIHVLFKNFIKDNRKILDVEKVATGEYWYGKDALDLKLIDKILTSDEHVISMKESFDIIHVKYMPPKSLSDKLSKFSSRFSSNLLQKFEQKNYDDHLFK